jgi:pilus assembly protein Flp/PilA
MDTQTMYDRTVRRFLRDEQGTTAIEYAMIAAGIAAVIVATVNALGVSVKGMYDTVSAALGS